MCGLLMKFPTQNNRENIASNKIFSEYQGIYLTKTQVWRDGWF
jgi:hypothetical protein